MRWPLSPFRWQTDRPDRKAGSFGRAMRTPLRWPRITTRLLMIVVAVVAVGIWAVMNVPRAIYETIAYQELAEIHADLERKSSEMERESATWASAIGSQYEEWRRDSARADEVTENYFVSRRALYDGDVEFLRRLAAQYAKLKNEYRRQSWRAFLSSAARSAPPPPPKWLPPLAREPVKIFEVITEGRVSSAFSPRGAGLAVGERDGTISLLELPSRRLLVSYPLPEKDAHFVIFSPDGATLFALGKGRLVRCWEVATGQVRSPIPWSDQAAGQPGPLDFATAMACSPDGRTIAVASGGFMGRPSKAVYAVRTLDARTGKLTWEHQGTGSWAYSVAFSPDGESVACGAEGAVLLDSRTGKLKKTFKPANGYVVAVAFSPDGRTLAGAGADSIAPGVGAGGSGRVTLWYTATGEVLQKLDGPTDHAIQVAFSPDGRTVAVAGTGPPKLGRDQSSGQHLSKTPSEVRAWDVATGKAVWIAEGECNAASSLSFAPDGRSLAFCDQEYVYIIDAQTGRLRQIVMETKRKVRSQQSASAKSDPMPGGRQSRNQ